VTTGAHQTTRILFVHKKTSKNNDFIQLYVVVVRTTQKRCAVTLREIARGRKWKGE